MVRELFEEFEEEVTITQLYRNFRISMEILEVFEMILFITLCVNYQTSENIHTHNLSLSITKINNHGK